MKLGQHQHGPEQVFDRLAASASGRATRSAAARSSSRRLACQRRTRRRSRRRSSGRLPCSATNPRSALRQGVGQRLAVREVDRFERRQLGGPHAHDLVAIRPAERAHQEIALQQRRPGPCDRRRPSLAAATRAVRRRRRGRLDVTATTGCHSTSTLVLRHRVCRETKRPLASGFSVVHSQASSVATRSGAAVGIVARGLRSKPAARPFGPLRHRSDQVDRIRRLSQMRREHDRPGRACRRRPS